MTATRDRIEQLVLRIQSEFLAHPTLALTLPTDVPAGIYQVRVLGLAATGHVVGRFSDAITVAIERQRT